MGKITHISAESALAATAVSEDAVFCFSAQNRLLSLNEAAGRMIGYPKDIPEDLEVSDIFPEKNVCVYFSDGRSRVFDTFLLSKFGRKIPVRLTTVGLKTDGKAQIVAVCRDLSPLHHAENRLRDKDEYLTFALETAGEAIWKFRAESGKFYFSDKFRQMLGYEAGQAGFDSLFEIVLHPDPAEVRRSLEAVAGRLVPPHPLEMCLRTAFGGKKWFKSILKILPRGNRQEVVGICFSIDERKRGEEALFRSNEKFNKAFKIIPNAVVISRLKDGMIVDVNPGFEKLTGFEEAESEGNTAESIGLWAEKADRKAFLDLLDRGDFIEQHFKLKRKNGKPFRALISSAVLEAGGEKYILSIISEELKAEKLLRKNNRLSEIFWEKAPTGIFIKDLNGKYLQLNNKITEISGIPAEDMVGKTDADFFSAKMAEGFRQSDRLVADSVVALSEEKELILPSGETAFYLISKFPIQSSNDEVLAIGGFAVDISDRKKAENKLMLLRENLQQEVGRRTAELEETNAALSRTLAEANRQADLLREHEEQLRQNMEDLSAGQEVILRKNREIEEFFRAVDAAAFTARLDDSGRIIRMNTSFAAFFGKKPEETENRFYREFTDPLRFAFDQLWAKIRQGTFTRRTAEIDGPEGKKKWVAENYAPIRDEAGRIKQILLIGFDITDQKELETRLKKQTDRMKIKEDVLRQSIEKTERTNVDLAQNKKELDEANSRFDLANRAVGEGLWELRFPLAGPRPEADSPMWFSERFADLLGLKNPAKAKNFGFLKSRLHPDQVEAFCEDYADFVSGKKPEDIFSREFLLRTESGEYRWFWAKAKIVRDSAGRPVREAGAAADIHEQKEAELSLLLVRFSLNNSGDAAWWISPEGKLLYANKAVGTLTGRDTDELLGLPISELIPKLTGGEWTRFRDKVRKRPAGTEEEVRMMSADGTLFPAEINCKYLTYKDNEYMFVSGRDIRRRKKNQKALEAAKEEAEIANRAKSKFLANMSHELRTPLNGILGYAQILEKVTENGDGRLDGIRIIRKSGEHLLALINEILDLSRIEAGKTEIRSDEVRLYDMLDNLAGVFRLSATNKNLEFRTEIAEDLPPYVLIDEQKVRQILINLLGNAFKFTETGHVLFSVKGRTEGNQIFLETEIADSGLGIPADMMDEIFLPFRQIRSDKNFGGTGLGLTITKKLTEVLGGTLRAESEPGVGSRFLIRLPIEPTDKVIEISKIGVRKIKGFTGPVRKILLVDDKKENLQLLHDLLQPLGFACRRAENGREAIEIAPAFGPDLVLMDIVMPVKDGYAATRALRKIPEFAQTPIIALSASVFARDMHRSTAAGCTDFMAKPVNVDDLLDKIGHYLNLQWINEQNEGYLPKNAPVGEMIIPEIEVLERLSDAANMGDAAEITLILDEISRQNPAFLPFAEDLREPLKYFKMKVLRERINELIGK